MKGTRRQQEGRNSFDLLEEATHLLRTAPLATLATYYAGAIPFMLGLLYFWADMSRSPFASQHLAASSLGLAVLFVWMKFFQAIFAGRVRAQIAATRGPNLSLRGCLRIVLDQAIIQPSALFVLPLALMPVLPFAWVYAFYQNMTVLSDGDVKKTSSLVKSAWSQARLWPRQNHMVLGILFVFGFGVFLNWVTVGATVPELFKMLFGVESVFTKSPEAMFNTTFIAGMGALTYLCVDPILKTIYVLRCFYGQSVQSGEDLKAELKIHSRPSLIPVALLIGGIMFALSLPMQTHAADPVTPSFVPVAAKPGISPTDLDHAINQTIHERKYTWRMPRAKVAEDDSNGNIFTRFLGRLGDMFRRWAHDVGEWLGRLLRWLMPHSHESSGGTGYGWIYSLQILLYGLIAVVVVALVFFIIRAWRGRQKAGEPVVSEPIQPVPDITDENVRADQLPEDGWMKLARELLERGEFRLAMRALYLSTLANLAGRNLINLARFKSNRDYQRELQRRAHSFPAMLSIFGDNLTAFEGIWYGMHAVNRDSVEQFAANVERMRVGT